ncbi:MAG: 2-dehydropantoate 2-reductase [Paucibacter sp.]|nr:2-dehydropantoate 2-reductase [Roseateles sp.]
MKVCIVGIGAVGGWLAAMLDGHAEISALARGATLAALREQGLRLDMQGRRRVVSLKASEDPAELGEQDLVIVAVKGPSLATAAPAIRTLIGERGRVLLAMNGVPWCFFEGLPGKAGGLRLESVDPGGRIAALIPTERVIGGVVHLSCTSPEPGLVRHVMGRRLIVGEMLGGRSDAVDSLAALLTTAGIEAETSERIQRDIWFKLWGNMTTNPISALTGATTDLIMADDLVRVFATRVMIEAEEMATHFGCATGQTPEDRHVITRKLGAFKTSMLQDWEAGRPLELDALLGAAHEVGRFLKVPTPNLDALLGLARLMASVRESARGSA